ncbi:cuticle protein-like [Tropilaelaps mercedesae]|uniref:Cuticle protein-like n=1 Tax=Tropilaelaps mercedesae TaxID=418985 RepID=A0A1V9WY81_9ACAR|nr:cuticle protein-like [Tropilaelaps mercedesae]
MMLVFGLQIWLSDWISVRDYRWRVLGCEIALVAGVAAESSGVVSIRRVTVRTTAGNYNFIYNIDSPSGGSYRDEKGSSGVAESISGLYVGDGRRRIVKYRANGTGLRAAISTTEPGTL